MQDEERYLQWVKDEDINTAHIVVPIGYLSQTAPANADAIAIACEDHLEHLEKIQHDDPDNFSIPYEIEETKHALKLINDGKPAYFCPFDGQTWGGIVPGEEEQETTVEEQIMREEEDIWAHFNFEDQSYWSDE